MDLTGKVALVTGGGRGIGKGCALALARRGAELLLNDRPDSPDLEETVSEIRALGTSCHPLPGDVFSRNGCTDVVEAALAQAGHLDILVSNPAYGIRMGFLEYDPEEFDRVVDATFKSGFHLGQLVARHLVERGEGGKIIFISSVHAQMPYARNAPYGAAKSALNSLARSMAVELGHHRINVNAIEPGWIDTPNERVTFTAEVLEEEGKTIPWRRLGTPEDIGNAAAFLASPESDYITGVVLPVDGGFRFKDLQANLLPDEVDPV